MFIKGILASFPTALIIVSFSASGFAISAEECGGEFTKRCANIYTGADTTRCERHYTLDEDSGIYSQCSATKGRWDWECRPYKECTKK